ncbi:hypothetical protein M8C13_27730 [Crossiella sp. SN42]|uniref:hypothetical protein n=1 Tax=Crossiella sp. SN42 TaxID=2944808 RepID=UPI00207D1F95|nr:hypothetical protein [Crossiella sp. SN42]MCO1579547.1 hypothetical protein [Crossiella sp. SN42]
MTQSGARALELSDFFPELTYVDLGGGFPVTEDGMEEFDYGEYDEAISRMFTDYPRKRARRIKLIPEPGPGLRGLQRHRHPAFAVLR